MKEKQLEKKFKDAVERKGGKALKFTSPGQRGMPDRIVLLPNARTVFVELKAPGERLRPLQRKRKAEFEALGFEVYRIDSTEAIDKFLAEVFT